MQARSQRFGGMMAELKHNPHRGKLERAATAVVQPVAWPTRGLFVLLSKKGSLSRLATLPRRGAGVRAVKLALCASLFAVAASAQSSADWIIDTFAGRAYVQENVPATEERLDFPQGVAVDSAGNLFLTDRNNHCIRMVDSSGIITTIAGTGERDRYIRYDGEGGPATEARLPYPDDVAVDGAGNLFITSQSRVLKVNSSGIISTIAGTGEYGFSGDGGPATEALLNSPSGVEVDASGNLYIVDAGNLRIRKVDSSGIISTVAGTGELGDSGYGTYGGDGGPAIEAQLNAPSEVAVDGEGNLYIADTFNNRIRKVDFAGIITTVAGTGERGTVLHDGSPATESRLFFPTGVTTDSAGNLYITDTHNHRVHKVDVSGIITRVVGNDDNLAIFLPSGRIGGLRGFSGDGGPATEALMDKPNGMAVDGDGNLYIADTQNARIRKVDSSGIITTFAGTVSVGDGGPASEAWVNGPAGVATDEAGNVYIADTGNRRVRKVDRSGVITTVAGTGAGGYLSGVLEGRPATEFQLESPSSVAVDGAGNLFIAETSYRRIYKVDRSGVISTIAGMGYGYGGDGGPATEAQLAYPRDLAVDSVGNLYIADADNHRIRKVDSSGIITTIAGTGQPGYGGDGGPATEAKLNEPHGVAADRTGNLYIADRKNHRIRKVDPSGIITTIAGTGELGYGGGGPRATEARVGFPHGVAVDNNGNLYIAEEHYSRVRKVDSSGVITISTGTGTRGFGGDGGPATEGQLYSPWDVAVDAGGRVYIADWENARIRILKPSPHPAIPSVGNQLDFILSGQP